MKWLLLVFAFTLITTNALAEWTLVYDGKSFSTYINHSFTRKNGDTVKIWTLDNFKTPQYGWLSSKAQHEFDCNEERVRLLAFIHTTDSMGSGDVISTETQIGDWQPIAPDTINEELWKIACDKQ